MAIFLAACSSQEDTSLPTNKPEKVTPVSVEQVALSDLTELFTLPANLEAWEDLSLSAEVSGPIQNIPYNEGSQVQKGDVLVEIDSESIRSLLHRDQQNVVTIERKFNRYHKLENEGLISKQELDDLENDLIAAKESLNTTRLQFKKSSPKAPISGTIDRIYVDRGEYVDPGMPLLRLVQIEKLKVIADVPEKDVPFLKVGQSVEIISAAINNLSSPPLTGTIEHIAFSANSTTRTYRTKIIIDNSSNQLRPGMIVRAQFVRQQLDQVISIPLFAVMDQDGDKVVFIAKDGVAHKINVKVGTSIGQRIVITEGLSVNQSVVISGQQLLSDGAKVVAGDR